MTDESGHVTEVWVYAGVRMDDDKKRTHAFIDPNDGKARYWADRGSYVVGGLYELKIDRRDGHTYRTGDPLFTGRRSDDTDMVAGFEITHESAERKLRGLAAERRAKRDGGVLDEACKPICEIAAGVKNFEDLERLISSVRRRLIGAWEHRETAT